jgi:hypothetical protein
MQLDRAAVDRVLRRASDMMADHPEVADGAQGPATTTDVVLLEAATEAGLDPDAVRLSLAIERLGPPPERRALDRLGGPRRVTVERVVRLDVDTALGRIDDLLQRQHQLRRTRSRAEAGEWRRRTGAVGKVQRAAKRASGDVGLAKVAVVEAQASPVDESRTVVRLAADRADQRTEVLAGGAVTTGVGAVAAGAAAVALTPLALVAVPVVAAAGAGVASIGRKQRALLADELDRVLDAVEHGLRPVTLSDDVRRVLRSIRR